MNANFLSEIQADVALFMEQFGGSATFTPADGSGASTISVIYGNLGQRNNSHDPSMDNEFDAGLAVRSEAWVGKEAATPVPGDALDSWVIDQVTEEGAFYHLWMTKQQGFVRG